MGHSHRLKSATAPDPISNISAPEPPDFSLVPPEYHVLVFSKRQALFLSPHRPYDYAIDLQLGATLPARLYNLSRPEREATEKHIHDSVSAGLICPSSSPRGAGFFFVDKKDQALRPCIDYRGLHKITVKNKYPLPLIDDAFEPLHQTKVFFEVRSHERLSPYPHHGGGRVEFRFLLPLGHFEY